MLPINNRCPRYTVDVLVYVQDGGRTSLPHMRSIDELDHFFEYKEIQISTPILRQLHTNSCAWLMVLTLFNEAI